MTRYRSGCYYESRTVPSPAASARPGRPRIAGVQDPLAELAGYFCRGTVVPDRELIRLAAAARAGGSRWEGIAAACGIADYRDITGVLTSPAGTGPIPARTCS